MEIIKLPYKIATLDTECLALHALNPVIDQIGVVVTNFFVKDHAFPANIDREPDVLEELFLEYHLITPSRLFQIIELGSIIEPETVAFRKESLRKNRGQSEYVKGSLSEKMTNYTTRPEEAFNHLCRAISDDIEEVWVLHPEFDLPRIKNLFRECGSELPWHYRKTRDLGTLREILKKNASIHLRDSCLQDLLGKMRNPRYPGKSEEESKRTALQGNHTALGDCTYNLWCLQVMSEYFNLFGRNKKNDQNLESFLWS